MTISHDVVERAARVVPETNAAAKIVSAIQRHDGANGNEITLSSPLSHCIPSSQEPLNVDLDVCQGRFGVCLWPA